MNDYHQNAIGCTRISTTQQQDGYGQDVQAGEIRREAERLGLTLQEIIEEVESGAKSDRSTVQAYYDLATAQPGLHFIFPRVDRIGRRARLILEIAEELLKRKANVHIIGVPGDLRTKEGWMMLTVLAGMAEYDYRSISSNLQAGKIKKARAGQWAHGKPPYGYRILRDERGVSTTLEVLEEEAAVVRLIYQLAQHHGAVWIAKELNRLGYPTRTWGVARQKSGWNDVAVQHIMVNPAYKGEFVFGQRTRPAVEWVTIPVPVIIEPQEWERVQRAVEERRKVRPPRTPEPQLVTGHVRCAVCGMSMRNIKQTIGTTTYRYHQCNYVQPNHAARRLTDTCSNRKRWRSDRLGEMIWQSLIDQVTDPEKLSGLLTPDPTPDHTARTADLKNKITDIWAGHYAGRFPEDVAIRLVQPYEEELKKLLKPSTPSTPSINLQELAEGLRWRLQGALSLEEKRQLLQELEARFYVGPEGVERVIISLR